MKVLTYYTAPWCSPCKTLLPKVRKLTEELGVQLDVVDVDVDPWHIPSHVKGVPTITVNDGDQAVAHLSPDMATIPALRKALA